MKLLGLIILTIDICDISSAIASWLSPQNSRQSQVMSRLEVAGTAHANKSRVTLETDNMVRKSQIYQFAGTNTRLLCDIKKGAEIIIVELY